MWYFLAPWFYLALTITIVVLLVRGWIWLSMRFPRTMLFINKSPPCSADGDGDGNARRDRPYTGQIVARDVAGWGVDGSGRS
jgi:hypothetical protein